MIQPAVVEVLTLAPIPAPSHAPANAAAHASSGGTSQPTNRTHGVVPPVAAAADLEPAVGIEVKRLEEADVDDEEHDRRGESDSRRAGDSLDGAGAGPLAGECDGGGDPDQQDHSADHQLDG